MRICFFAGAIYRLRQQGNQSLGSPDCALRAQSGEPERFGFALPAHRAGSAKPKETEFNPSQS
jgi:hypothetical protein